jgi:hypothetical protein
MNLKTVLERYSQPTSIKMGGPSTASPAALTPKRQALMDELKKVQASNRLSYWICVGIIVLLIVISVAQLWLNTLRPDILKAVTAFIGVSASAMAIWLVRLWREKLAIETLLVLAVYGNDEALQLLLDWWAQKLKSFL